mmetsp:Transcript_35097/g.85018  ORF Transcript_35097/g.85018 Transcript_35097/m.85018 type:complete len:266 (+) Transcript_35097:2682-3479(+)
MIGHSITCANIPESRPKTLKKVDATLRTKARTQVFPWKALGAGAPGCDECEVPSIVLVFHNEASTKSGRQDDASASRLSRFLLYSFLKTVWPVSKAPLITSLQTTRAPTFSWIKFSSKYSDRAKCLKLLSQKSDRSASTRRDPCFQPIVAPRCLSILRKSTPVSLPIWRSRRCVIDSRPLATFSTLPGIQDSKSTSPNATRDALMLLDAARATDPSVPRHRIYPFRSCNCIRICVCLHPLAIDRVSPANDSILGIIHDFLSCWEF